MACYVVRNISIISLKSLEVCKVLYYQITYAMTETDGRLNHSPSDLWLKSSKASSKSRSIAEDLAAMGHLRSVIESFTLDKNMSPLERKRKVSDFNHSLIEAKQWLYYHANNFPKLNLDPLALSSLKMSAKKNAHAAVGAIGSEKTMKKEGGWLKLV
jgi:hypothetical protein